MLGNDVVWIREGSNDVADGGYLLSHVFGHTVRIGDCQTRTTLVALE